MMLLSSSATKYSTTSGSFSPITSTPSVTRRFVEFKSFLKKWFLKRLWWAQTLKLTKYGHNTTTTTTIKQNEGDVETHQTFKHQDRCQLLTESTWWQRGVTSSHFLLPFRWGRLERVSLWPTSFPPLPAQSQIKISIYPGEVQTPSMSRSQLPGAVSIIWYTNRYSANIGFIIWCWSGRVGRERTIIRNVMLDIIIPFF